MNRPMVWVAIGVAAGTLCAARGFLPGLFVPILVACIGIALAFGLHRFRVTPVWSVAIVFCGCAAFLWNVRSADFEWDAFSRVVLGRLQAAPAVENPMVVTGRVRSTDVLLIGDTYTNLIVDVDSYGGPGHETPVTGRVLVRWTGPSQPIYPGERVVVRGEADIRIGSVNFGLSDVEEHYRRRGVHSMIVARGKTGVSVVDGARWWNAPYWAGRLRQWQAEMFAHVTPKDVLAFVLAVWLGDRSAISQEEIRGYVGTGTAHILAVSGVHVGIVYASLEFLLGLFIRRRPVRTLVILAAVLLFVLMAGARVSSLRAMLMIACYLAADLVRRERDAPTALSIGLIALLAWNPRLLFDVGFLLSFASVTSILVFGDMIQRATMDRPWPFASAVWTTFGVQVIPLPLAIRYFHILPVLGPVANLVIVPLLTVVLWLCLMTALVSTVSLPAGTVIGHALAPPIVAIRYTAELLSNLVTHVYLPTPTNGAIALYWIAVMVWAGAFWHRDHWRRYAVAGSVAFVAVGVLWRPMFVEPQVLFFDVGHGDAALVATEDGRTMLIDGGDDNGYIDMGERVVAPSIWALGYSHIDHVFVTHADRDHMAGLFYVIEHLRVGEVTMGLHASGSELELALVALCKRRGVPVSRVGRGDELMLGSTRIEVLHPARDQAQWAGENNGSLVLRVWWDGVPILFSGDVEAEAEAVLPEDDLPAAILKAPHHGSNTSSTAGFLKAVAPDLAVISTGPGYRNRGLDPEILARYEDLKISTFQTNQNGAVRVVRRGTKLVAESARALPEDIGK